MTALFLFAGFGLLLLGGEFLVRGSVAIALKLRISKVIIGLTLVAFATSAPELIVSIIAAMNGKSAIALGNVIGSNVANIGLILGLTALLYKMEAVRLTYRNDWLFLLGANGLLGVFLYFGGISFIQGLILVAALAVYNTLKIRSARKERAAVSIGQDFDVPAMPVWQGVVLLIIGAVGLKFGAQLFVSGISTLAAQWGWSERLVAVSLVAFGTSVPELAASLMAARKGEADIAIGNIIGSNIFNILSVLGFTALIQPIALDEKALLYVDFPISFLFALVLIPLMGVLKSDRLDRFEGAVLLILYTAYMIYLFS
ncbi:MAG: calcium/sodium antiporter [Bacteroidetes bacterium]|nr:calcium/sodium antiporter [Bacteroidota bacterium]